MSDAEQRQVVIRGVSVAACVVAVSTAMPAVSVSYKIKQDLAERRDETLRFAQTEDGGDAVRADARAPAILNHPWLVNVEYTLKRDPNSVLNKYTVRDRDRAALSTVESFKSRHFKRAETVVREHQCMAEAVYYEARSEGLVGELAVAEVIDNRVRDHRYPNTVCGVVYQGATRTTGCQFTFTCDGSLNRNPRGERWEEAQRVAAHVMMGSYERRTGAATHYHATYVDPIWNSGLIRTSRIGQHIFYRFPRGGEWASVRTAMAERRAADQKVRIIRASAESSEGGAPAPKILTPAPT